MANVGETVETDRLYLGGGSKISAEGDCRHESKRCFFLGRKVMTNLDSILKGPGKNTGVGCHFFLQYMKVKSESEVAQSCLMGRQ